MKRKSAAAVLVLVLFSPTIVLAQEVSSVVQQESVILDTPMPAMDGAGSVPQTAEVMVPPDSMTLTASAVSADVSSPPPLYHFSNAQLLDTTETGALRYRIAIETPPGRMGMQPDLVLAYQNQSKTDSSAYGYGWSDNIPYIERLPKKGVDQLYDGKYFTSSAQGELVYASSTSAYVPRMADGQFTTYTFSGTSWTMTDKNGVVYTFGADAAARMDDPENPSRVYRWMLEEVRDPNGNYVRYAYAKSKGQIYPSSIAYTGNGTDSGMFAVSFVREPRPNPVSSFIAGFEVITDERVKEISITVKGEWVRKYALEYKAGDNGRRSLLGAVTESGRDESGASVLLPKTEFTYAVNTQEWNNTNTQVQVSSTEHPSPLEKGYGSVLADVNGDGVSDFVQDNINMLLGSGVAYINVSNGVTPGANITWNLPAEFILNNNKNGGYAIVDVNGDGYADLLRDNLFPQPSLVSVGPRVYINNKVNGWVEDSNYRFPEGVRLLQDPKNGRGFAVTDVNNDGMADLLVGGGVYLNYGDGTGWTSDTTRWELPKENFSLAARRGSPPVIADLNGDGLVDLMQTNPGTPVYTSVFLNNGVNGWREEKSWTIPEGLDILYAKERAVFVLDANGDGLPDIIQRNIQNGADVYATYLNRGNGWVDGGNWVLPFAILPSGNNIAMPGDINGDGRVDFLAVTNGVNRHNIFLNAQDRVDSLVSVVDKKGARINISYKETPLYKNTLPLNPKLPLVLDVVDTLEVFDGVGATETTQFTYEGGEYYFASSSPYDHAFAGFAKITETDGAGNKTASFYHQGNATNAALGEYKDSRSKLGKVYRVEQYDAANALYKASVTKWDTKVVGGRNFVQQAQKTTLLYDGDADHKDSAETYTYDNVGNVTAKVEWGEILAKDDGTFVDMGADKRTTAFVYAADTAKRVVGLPSKEVVTNQGGTKVKETLHHYDNLPLGSVSRGNETKTQKWKEDAAYVTSTKIFNTYGLVTKAIDSRGNATTYIYDTHMLYPMFVTNAKEQKTSYVYDYSSGKIKLITDANGLRTQVVYDGLDRPVIERQSDLTVPATLVNKKTYTYTDTPGSRRVLERAYTDSGDVMTYTYLDGFDRKIQNRKETETANQYAVQDFIYNNQGLLARESLPYFASEAAKTAPTNISALYTNYTYDPLQRVRATQTAMGSTTSSFDQWTTKVTDVMGRVKNFSYDAYGNLTRVIERSGAPYVSTYVYDGANNLVRITDAEKNVREFTYDGLGRRVAAQDLHDAADTVFGVWTYAYDDAGNLAAQTDPKGQKTTVTYDELNRPVAEDFVGKEGVEMLYTYDTCANGIGRLCSAAGIGVVTAYTYNALGLPASEVKTIGAAAYTTGFTYDRQGKFVLIAYPDKAEVRYGYNAAGLPETVEYKQTPSAAFVPVIKNIDYNPTEKMVSKLFGSGAKTFYTFDANQLYRLKNIRTVAGTSTLPLQDISYTYDRVGNITKIQDKSNTAAAKVIAFTYDGLYRLASASTTAASSTPFVQTYTYSPVGNLLTKSDQGAYVYAQTSYANPHAATTIGSTTLTYDKNGNVLTRSPYAYTWDYKNQLTSVRVASTTATYRYDHNGERVLKNANSTLTYYPNQYFTKSATTTKSIYVGSDLVATLESRGAVTSLHYIHPDHLGSVNLATNAQGKVVHTLDYYPFGAQRIDVGTDVNQREYIGEEYDEESNLSYLNARYYEGSRGQFLSQDPVFWEVGQSQDGMMALFAPQTQNSYSYAANNPINSKDPSGRYVESSLDAISLAMSIQAYNQDPTFGNAFFAGLDGLSLAVPLPALVGYARHGDQAIKIGKYFNEVSGRNGTNVAQLAKLYVQNANFKMTQTAWSAGTAGNRTASLVGHFSLHGAEVGAKSVADYYNKANNIINSVDNKSVFKLDGLYRKGSVEYYDKSTNTLVGMGKDGSISTYHKVTDSSKLQKIKNAIK